MICENNSSFRKFEQLLAYPSQDGHKTKLFDTKVSFFYHFTILYDQRGILTMSYRVGILPSLTPAHGFMSYRVGFFMQFEDDNLEFAKIVKQWNVKIISVSIVFLDLVGCFDLSYVEWDMSISMSAAIYYQDLM